MEIHPEIRKGKIATSRTCDPSVLHNIIQLGQCQEEILKNLEKKWYPFHERRIQGFSELVDNAKKPDA